ncbi:hypothetical protein ACRHK7_03105 [Weissella tructae]|uniref:Uncharacterized protein n=2 Tax=Weissella TaxID=46255 RepID=A0A075U0S4_9LACO|nr:MULTISPECIES: hypothetical protein [Weissella]AIG66150.1 hypothetical protein WS08_1212 [Weissella tructae]AIM63531.1 hypothetical protein WS74_1282 [Weissella ceti]AIM64867.1 hypothetical protein WS105_1277 [Weissella ceti]ELA07523.1 hypothetical protein WCNC_03667 [Weissella ceti NC36]QVV91299.1 hypothetical protein KHQ32_06720 [Weissella tructae]
MESIISSIVSDVISGVILIGIAILGTVLFWKITGRTSVVDLLANIQRDVEDAINKKYLQLGSSPNGEQRIEEFIADNIVAIGWPAIGDLSEFTTYSVQKKKDIIYPKIEQHYPGLSSRALGLYTGYFVRFLSVKPGDVLVVRPSGTNELYFLVVKSAYKYNVALASKDMAHTIEFDPNRSLKIKNLDTITKNMVAVPDEKTIEDFKKSVLMARLTITDLSKFDRLIEAIFESDSEYIESIEK